MNSPFPRDPSAPFAAAPTYGWLVAVGLMERDEALASMLAAANMQADPSIDRSGLRARVAWALTDATTWAERMRRQVDRKIRKRLAPLLASRKPWDTLIAAAQAVNNEEQHVGEQPMLLPHELNEIVAEEAAWWLRRSKRNV